MDLFPAIDLRNGKCVRLHQGDYGQETVYGDDPVAQALFFADFVVGVSDSRQCEGEGCQVAGGAWVVFLQ